MMLSTFMILFTTIIATVDCACRHCNKCVDDKCIDPVNNKCRCERGCKPGFFGAQCANSCPQQCVSCGREYLNVRDPTYNICYECTDGYLNGSSTNCSCQIENFGSGADRKCNVCIPGKYGDNCDNVCLSTTCLSNECDRAVGTCKNGCTKNFALGVDSKCDVCIPGKYGDNCDNVCLSTTCLNNECDRDAGTCTNGCIENFAFGANSKCNVCIPGKYGLNCTTECHSTKCLNNECDRENGQCSKGCTSPNIIGTYCNACINGTHGDNCKITCPNNCKDNVCSRYEGTCTNGCKGVQYIGTTCNQCTIGYYGDHCNNSCPVNCQYNTCTKDKGECSRGCVGNFAGKKCDVCKIGIFGLFCNQTCSVGCNADECNQVNGNCINGCNDGYTGNKGCVKNGFCELCQNTTLCTQCEAGYFGEICNLSCPVNCLSGCSRGNGLCTTCKRGYFGSECGSHCPGTCNMSHALDVCDFETGNCLHGCMMGYYDDQCKNNCGKNCVEGICDQDAGKCSECITGYHGDKCDVRCSNTCVNNTCSQDGGGCMYGCSDDFQGQDCSEDTIYLPGICEIRPECFVSKIRSGAKGTSQSLFLIATSVVGGCSIVANIVLVTYICYTRRKIPTTVALHEQLANVERLAQLSDVPENGESSESHVYEGLDSNMIADISIYSVPKAEATYVNTEI